MKKFFVLLLTLCALALFGAAALAETCNHEAGSLEASHLTVASYLPLNEETMTISGTVLRREINHRVFYSEQSGFICTKCSAFIPDDTPPVCAETDSYFDKIDSLAHHHFEGGVCKDCGYVCQHAYSGEPYYMVHYEEPEEELVFRPDDSPTHSQHIQYRVCHARYIRCDYCWEDGPRQEGTFLIQYGYSSSHDFDENGYCATCDFQCPHVNRTPVVHKHVDEEPSYAASNGEETHTYMTYYIDGEKCDLCDVFLPDASTRRAEPVSTWEHIFTAEGTCKECGEPCPHRDTYPSGYADPTGETGFHPTEGGHYPYEIYATYVEICEVCYLHVNRPGRYEIPGETVPHVFDGNGYCATCGYQCPHEDTCVTHEDLQDGYCHMADAADPASGHRSGKLYGTEVETCNACRAIVRRNTGAYFEEDGQGRLYPHVYNDASGVCALCGYIHDHTGHLVDADRWVSVGDSESLGAEGHRMTGTLAAFKRCEVCGWEQPESEWVRKEKQGETEPHRYNAGGVCEACYYQCPHGVGTRQGAALMLSDVHTYSWLNAGNPNVNTFHDKYSWYAYPLYCAGCGRLEGWAREGRERVEASELEAHDYKDGVCRECGYTNLCRHQSVSRWYEPVYMGQFYDNVDDESHSYRVVYQECDRCQDCGEFLPVPGTETYNGPYTERHDYYNNNGVCTQCGHTCGHPAAERDFFEYKDPTGEYACHPYSDPAQGHTRHALYGTRVDVCRLCSTSVETGGVYEEVVYNPVAHAFDDKGVCADCGYEAELLGPDAPGEAPADPGEAPSDPGEAPADPGNTPDDPGDPLTPGDAPANPAEPAAPAEPVAPVEPAVPAEVAPTEQTGESPAETPAPAPLSTVKLNKTGTVKLKKSKTLTLKATVTPSGTGALTWSSSKKSVAKVNAKGKVTAVASGTAVITVATADGATDSVKIKVTATKPKSVKLNKTGTVKLKKGKSLTLKVTFSPATAESKLTWKSDNKKVATVSKKGKVKAVGKGTAVITVKTANGKKAKVKIKVK